MLLYGPIVLREFWCGAESFVTFLSQFDEGFIDRKCRCMTLQALIRPFCTGIYLLVF